MQSKLQQLKTELEKDPTSKIDFNQGEEVIFKALENYKDTNKSIFVREDGKVGFPTFNSISFETGDLVKGRIKIDHDTCFFIEVYEIIEKGKTDETK